MICRFRLLTHQPGSPTCDGLIHLINSSFLASCLSTLLLITSLLPVSAQVPAGTIDTIVSSSNGDGYPAETAAISPFDLAFDGSGDLFLTQRFSPELRRVDSSTAQLGDDGSPDLGTAIISTVSSGVPLVGATGVVAFGNTVYVADGFGHQVWKRDSSGSWSVFAGTGNAGVGADGVQATSSQLNSPIALTVDAIGNVFISDAGNGKIRRVVISTGVITTVAGNLQGSLDDGVLALQAKLSTPQGIAVAPNGDLYIADKFSQRVRRVDAQTSLITTVAGIINDPGSFGDGGLAVNAHLSQPTDIAFASNGDLLIVDSTNHRVRHISNATGIINTIAGGGIQTIQNSGTVATLASLFNPQTIAVDGLGDIWVVENSNERILRIRNGSIAPIVARSNGNGYPAEVAKITPFGISLDDQSNLYLYDNDSFSIRWVDGASSITDNVSGLSSLLVGPQNTHVDSLGRLYVVDKFGHKVWRRTTSGNWETVAGTGSPGIPTSGSPATSSKLNSPQDVAVHTNGDVFILDTGNQRVHRVDATSGNIFIVAGGGSVLGNGGPATAAKLASPRGIDIDEDGNILIADTNNHSIRKVTMSTGIIDTVAGDCDATRCYFGSFGDGGQADRARLQRPTDIAASAGGDIFIADTENEKIRWVDGDTNIIHRIVGTGIGGFLGDGGPAENARLNDPQSIALDSSGDLWIADTGNGKIRKVDFPSSSASVSGLVTYYSNQQPMLGTEVSLDIGGSASVGVNGDYNLADIDLKPLSITPHSELDTSQAISPLDATLVLQAEVGLQNLSVAQRLAADVTGNGTVSAFDAVRILQYSVSAISQLPVHGCSKWGFLPVPVAATNQTLQNPIPNPANCIDGAIHFNPLSGDVTGQDFIAVAYGDPTGNWQPPTGGAASIGSRSVASEQARVVVGKSVQRGRRFRTGFAVRSARSYHTLNLSIAYSHRHLSKPRLRRHKSLREAGAVAVMNEVRPGLLRIAIASPNPIDPGKAFALRFRSNRRIRQRKPVRIIESTVETGLAP